MSNTTSQPKNKITTIHGPIFSGKTTFLIDLVKKDKSLAFKPNIDKRYTKKSVLKSHNQREAPAIMVSIEKPEEILLHLNKLPKNQKPETVIIDESNFFSLDLIPIIEKLLGLGYQVTVAGLLLDSEKKDFGATPGLVKMADEVIELHGKCDFKNCKKPAIYTYAKKEKKSQLVVGASEMYGPACEIHYSMLHQNKPFKKKPVKQPNLADYGVYPGFIDWFKDMDLPLFRKSAPKKNRPYPHIEIGGDSMRVGKTTAMGVLGKGFDVLGLPVMMVDEDWRSNPYVVGSYGDSPETILKSQKWFANRKLEQIQARSQDSISLLCVHPEMDFCYAATNVLLGRLSLKLFEKYIKYYNQLDWNSIPAPDLLIYLTTSDDVLVDRCINSVRDFETVDPNYFLVMRAINLAWLEKGKKAMNVLVVNTDNLDFSKKQKDKQLFIKLVQDKLQELGWGPNLKPKKKDPQEEALEKINSSQVVIMCGLPGSGKSYLARKLRDKYGYTWLNSDRLRKKISKQERFATDGHKKAQEQSNKAYKLLYQNAKDHIVQNKKVVIDATNLKQELIDGLKVVKTTSKDVTVVTVKTNQEIIANRMKRKRGMANEKETYYQAWKRVYGYFENSLSKGHFFWPDEKKLGVKVIEVWNQ